MCSQTAAAAASSAERRRERAAPKEGSAGPSAAASRAWSAARLCPRTAIALSSAWNVSAAAVRAARPARAAGPRVRPKQEEFKG